MLLRTATAVAVSLGCALAGELTHAVVGDSGEKLSDGDLVSLLRSRGDAESQFEYGVLLSEGHLVPRDEHRALEMFTRAAAQGHAAAATRLGVLHFEGKGGAPLDLDAAAQWFRLAAGRGSARAAANLGVMHHKGQGAPQDDKEAFKWYKKAAEGGDRDAASNVGALYHQGVGVGRNGAKAAHWYKIALKPLPETGAGGPSIAEQLWGRPGRLAEAARGEVLAALGLLYHMGEGVEQDAELARQYYAEAAELGNDQGQHGTAQMLFAQGKEQEAAEYLRKAAEQGFAAAQAELGAFYRDGRGVKRNAREAVRWLRKAAEQRHAHAAAALAELVPAERELWQRRAAEYAEPQGGGEEL